MKIHLRLCVILDSEFKPFDSFHRFVKDARVQITFPSEDLALNVAGTVIWSRKIDSKDGQTIALGMQFQEMSPKSRGMLLGFASNLSRMASEDPLPGNEQRKQP